MITYIADFLNPFKGQEIPKKNPTESEAEASNGSAAYQFFSNNIKAITSVSLIYAIIFAGFTPMSVRLMMMAVPLTGVLDVYLARGFFSYLGEASGMSKLAKAFFQEEEVEQLSGELKKAAAENAGLQAQLSEAENKVKELQQLREQIERIQTATQNYASSLPEGTNLSAENVIQLFAAKVVEQNRKIAEQTKENEKKEEEYAQIQHQLEEARQALQNTINKAGEVAAQQNKKIGTLSSNLRSAQLDLNAALVKVSGQESEIQKHMTALEALGTEKDETVERLEGALKEAQEKLATGEILSSRQKEALLEIQSSLTKTTREKEALDQELNALRNTFEETQISSKEQTQTISALKTQIERLNTEIDGQRQAVDQQNKKIRQMEINSDAAVKKICSQESQIQKLQGRVTTLEGLGEEKNAMVARLQDELKAAQEQLTQEKNLSAQKQQELEEITKEKEALGQTFNSKIQSFEQQLESFHAALSQEKEKTQELQQMQTERTMAHQQESQMNAPTLPMSLTREEKPEEGASAIQSLRNINRLRNLPGHPFPSHQMLMNVGGGNLSFQPHLTARAALPMSKVVFSVMSHLPK